MSQEAIGREATARLYLEECRSGNFVHGQVLKRICEAEPELAQHLGASHTELEHFAAGNDLFEVAWLLVKKMSGDGRFDQSLREHLERTSPEALAAFLRNEFLSSHIQEVA